MSNDKVIQVDETKSDHVLASNWQLMDDHLVNDDGERLIDVLFPDECRTVFRYKNGNPYHCYRNNIVYYWTSTDDVTVEMSPLVVDVLGDNPSAAIGNLISRALAEGWQVSC